MLRVNQLNGFGVPLQITTLRQAGFLLLPSQSRVAIDGTGGFPDAGGNVGTIVNQGTLGGSLFATNNANRATLQGLSRMAVRGNTNVQMPRTLTAFTGPVIYTITAFIPRAANNFERILSIAENATSDDFGSGAGSCLLIRDGTSTNWGVYRGGTMRQQVTAADDSLTIFETICESTQTTVCKDGGTDQVASHSALGNFNASSFRFLSAHNIGGAYGSGTSADVLVSAVFFANPTANFRSRALAEVRAIAGIATP
jgi:hypothetical protein